MHWKSLTAEQRKKVLESHIFVEKKQDGLLKAQQVAGGNKQQGYITKEMQAPLRCLQRLLSSRVLSMQLKRGMLLLLIFQMHSFELLLRMKRTEHSFASTVRWLILGSIAPDIYGPYVTVRKKGEKQLLVQCLTALHGTMVALLLYYKKFVKSLKLNGFRLNPYDPCMANKQVKEERLTVCFHVDNCKILHLIPKVVDETIE